MAAPAKLNYKIYQGSTFQEVYRWESETKVYQPITNIAKTAPCTISTAGPPQLPAGWRFRVVGASGMKEINTPLDSWYLATSINTDTSTVEINSVNSIGYSNYTGGGVIEYNMPVPLDGISAAMQIRPEIGSSIVLYSTTSAPDGGITIDSINSTITVTIPATVTSEFLFTTAVYAVELYSSDGAVIPFLTGNLTLIPEIVK